MASKRPAPPASSPPDVGGGGEAAPKSLPPLDPLQQPVGGAHAVGYDESERQAHMPRTSTVSGYLPPTVSLHAEPTAGLWSVASGEVSFARER